MSTSAAKKRVLVMVFGTFDGLHKGHLHFFKQAKKLAPKAELVVSVARDKNVKNIKGHAPYLSEKDRIKLVKKSFLVKKVVLSGLDDHIPHILKEKPEIIALGYDQRAYVSNLKKDLAKAGLKVRVVRLKPYKPHIYKNRLIKYRSFLSSKPRKLHTKSLRLAQ